MRAREYRRDGGARQRVVQALVHGQRFAGRRKRPVEQVSAAEGLHYGNRDSRALAVFVERLALRVHVDERLLVIIAVPELFAVLGRWLEVVAWVDAEHYHVYEAALSRGHRRFGVVAAHADSLYPTRRFEPARVLHDRAVHDAVPVVERVGVVNHADVYVIRAEARKQVLEARAHLDDVARALVLPVLPRRAEVRLNHEFIAPPAQRLAREAAHLGRRRIEVEAVDARRRGAVEERLRVLSFMVDEAFAADAYLADLQPRPS